MVRLKGRSTSHTSATMANSSSSTSSPSSYRILDAFPVIFLLCSTFYFITFMLHILDVNFYDSSGLRKAYTSLRQQEFDQAKIIQKEDTRYHTEQSQQANQDYQGDKISPWDNPFMSDKTIVGRAKTNKEKQFEQTFLYKNLHEATLQYIEAHQDELENATPNDVSKLLTEENPIIKKLRKRQKFVEDKFDQVSAIEMAKDPREYGYKSIFKGGDSKLLTIPPTISFNKFEKKGFLSSLGSFFSSSSSSSTKQTNKSENLTNLLSQNDDDDDILKLRAEQKFASLADKSKLKKSSSILKLESSLNNFNYRRHKGPPTPLPMWVLAYGRKCPSIPKSVLSKSTIQNVLICSIWQHPSSFSFQTNGRHIFPYADINSMINIEILKENPKIKYLHESINKVGDKKARFSWPFFRFYKESDRKNLLKSKQLSSYPGGFVVVQNNGNSNRPQIVKSVKNIVEKASYQDENIGIVAAPLPLKPRLWSNGEQFALRSWAIIVANRAYFVLGDVIVSPIPHTPPNFETKESSETTLKMRFPSWQKFDDQGDENMEKVNKNIFPYLSLLENIKISKKQIQLIAERQKQITTWVALSHLLESDKNKNIDRNINYVQHICIDFSLTSGLVSELLSIGYDCPLTATTFETQNLITSQIFLETERIIAHPKDNFSNLRKNDQLKLIVDKNHSPLM